MRPMLCAAVVTEDGDAPVEGQSTA
jgi:hypothetical protein